MQNAELLTLTYSAIRCQLFTDLEEVKEVDSSRKISKLDETNFGELEDLKEINKRSEETGVDLS